MPSIKRNVASAPDRTGFEPYDGPTPKRGFYRGIIKVARIRKAGTGRLGISVLVELKATPGSADSQYDGYAQWVDIWLGDEEALQTREKMFYRAVGVNPESANVVHDELDDGGKIKNISGKSPIGAEVVIELKDDVYEGEKRLKGDGITPVKNKTSSDLADRNAAQIPTDEEDDETDLLADAEPEEDDEAWTPYTEDELKAMSVAELKEVAKSLDVKPAGKKSDVIAAIQAAQDEILNASEAIEEELEEEELEEELEDAEDAEEVEEDPEALLREELSGLDRAALKKRVKAGNPEFKIFVSTTDDALRDAIVEAELGSEEPF